MSTRTLKHEGRTREYLPSTTKLLLEEMCQSFGTELLEAQIHMAAVESLLVRNSKPAVIKSPTGKRILQFQHTRFSRLHDEDRALDVYIQNRMRHKGKRKISTATAIDEIYAQHEPWDVAKELTDISYVKDLSLHRWPKGIYVAVYDAPDLKGKDELKPFNVYETVEFGGKLPNVHIIFRVEPFFVIGQMRQSTRDIYDTLAIDFPQIRAEHRRNEQTALDLYQLNNLKSPEKAFEHNYERFGESYQIHSQIPREATMGFIQAYLRKFCLNRTL